MTLDYSHFSIYAVLRALLPAELKEVPTGFETVGHIAHFNLREEYLPFKSLIGKHGVTVNNNISMETTGIILDGNTFL